MAIKPGDTVFYKKLEWTVVGRSGSKSEKLYVLDRFQKRDDQWIHEHATNVPKCEIKRKRRL